MTKSTTEIIKGMVSGDEEQHCGMAQSDSDAILDFNKLLKKKNHRAQILSKIHQIWYICSSQQALQVGLIFS